jgi:aerobic-type carbon monoxide dehydrogenase small subunit (CoxS/CutS family)
MAVTRTLVRGGAAHAVTMPDDGDLLQAARALLGVRSASRGCADGSCGACRMLLDGELVKACRVKIGDVRDGAVVEAWEDLEGDPAAVRAVAAFDAERPTRCSLCVGAVGVTAAWLARTGRAGRPAAVDDVVASANCVCTGKGSLRRALLTR